MLEFITNTITNPYLVIILLTLLALLELRASIPYGVIGGYLLGFKFLDLLLSTIYGVLIAGIIFLDILLARVASFNYFIKAI